MSVRDVIQAAAGSATGDSKQFIEDLFSVHLYTGNGSTQTITNGIDLAGKGGMVWRKAREAETFSANVLADTVRGRASQLSIGNTPTTYSEEGAYFSPAGTDLVSFDSSGFTIGPDTYWNKNTSGKKYVSWTFRKAPKFFDVVQYTGGGSIGRQVQHSLGVTPGMIVIKVINSSDVWAVWHRGSGSGLTGRFNTTGALSAAPNDPSVQGTITSANASYFTVGSFAEVNNSSSQQYIAYLFAHDTTTDGLIQCGSFTAGASGFSEVNLGWEPQYILFKTTSVSQNWYVWDTMRGMALTSSVSLQPNLSNAEFNWGSSSYVYPTTKGFAGSGDFFGNGANVIYMAIRRGPMKTPTDGTKVFSTETHSSPSLNTKYTYTTGFPIDTLWQAVRAPGGTYKFLVSDRMRVSNGTTTTNTLVTCVTDNETSVNGYASLWFDNNTGYSVNDTNGSWNGSPTYPSASSWSFQRAPGFFDVVCYTGDGGGGNKTHNLGVTPELIIVKNRTTASTNWSVWHNSFPLNDGTNIYLNSSAAKFQYGGLCFQIAPTSTTFQVRFEVATSANNFVAYLFASCPGVSKVFSFTGNGSSQTINCGFTNGARLVLIKRTDSTGDWYIWDTARGIVAGNDPHLSLNSTAAEVTTNDTIDPDSTGFIVNQVSATNVNVNGASYIGLAIA